MEDLTKKEEEVMQKLWSLKKAFVKDIVAEFSGKKPPYNTISSVVRILVKKGFVDFKQYGNTYEYFPKVTKKSYRKSMFKSMMANYFDGSMEKVVSFMAKENKIDEAETEELLKIIENSGKD